MGEGVELFESECFLSLAQRAYRPSLPLLSASQANAEVPLGVLHGPSSRLGDAVFTRPLPKVVTERALRDYDGLARLRAMAMKDAVEPRAAPAAAAAPAPSNKRVTRASAAAAAEPAKARGRTGTAAAAAPAAAAAAAPAAAGEGAKAGGHSLACIKRVLKELNALTRSPLPDFKLFICPDDLLTWRVLMRAPSESAYVGATFELTIAFPLNYPAVAPEVRFRDRITHCNVNSNGRICSAVLGRHYVPTFSLSDMLLQIQALLLTPEPDDPLDSVLAGEWRWEWAVVTGFCLCNKIKVCGRVAIVTPSSFYPPPLTSSVLVQSSCAPTAPRTTPAARPPPSSTQCAPSLSAAQRWRRPLRDLTLAQGQLAVQPRQRRHLQPPAAAQRPQAQSGGYGGAARGAHFRGTLHPGTPAVPRHWGAIRRARGGLARLWRGVLLRESGTVGPHASQGAHGSSDGQGAARVRYWHRVRAAGGRRQEGVRRPSQEARAHGGGRGRVSKR